MSETRTNRYTHIAYTCRYPPFLKKRKQYLKTPTHAHTHTHTQTKPERNKSTHPVVKSRTFVTNPCRHIHEAADILSCTDQYSETPLRTNRHTCMHTHTHTHTHTLKDTHAYTGRQVYTNIYAYRQIKPKAPRKRERHTYAPMIVRRPSTSATTSTTDGWGSASTKHRNTFLLHKSQYF